MLGTHRDRIDCEIVRPIATHGKRKPDQALVVALVRSAIAELPANGIRRQALEQMIERATGQMAGLTSSSECIT